MLTLGGRVTDDRLVMTFTLLGVPLNVIRCMILYLIGDDVSDV
jgi:hypothetical protein